MNRLTDKQRSARLKVLEMKAHAFSESIVVLQDKLRELEIELKNTLKEIRALR